MGANAKKRPRPLQRAVLTLDLDCFYAQVAIRARPHLKDKPVVIVQKHLCVTSNYVARRRAHGAVQKMTPVSKALRACPDLVQIDGSDLTPFRAANAEVMAVVRSFLQTRVAKLCNATSQTHFQLPCQRQGLDEVFIDVSQLVAAEIAAGGRPWRFAGHVFGVTEDDNLRRTLMVASQIASELREAITEKTRLTLCAGISDRKLLAKLAVDMNKPDDQTAFLPGRVMEYVMGLTPREIPGIGYAMDAKLQAWVTKGNGGPKISTAGGLLQCFGGGTEGLRTLTSILGQEAVARTVLNLCKGEDDSPVVESGDAPKSMASMDSFRTCTTMDDLRQRVRVRAVDLVSRLLQDAQTFRRRPKTLTVSFRFRGDSFHGVIRATSMPTEVASLGSSRGTKAVEACITAIQKTVLVVLEEQGNVSVSSKFDLTLLAIGAANFTEQMIPSSGNGYSPSKIDSFFKKSTTGQRTERGSEGNGARIDSRTVKSPVAPACPICNRQLFGGTIQVTRHVDKCLQQGERKTVRKEAKTSSNTKRVDSFFRRQ